MEALKKKQEERKKAKMKQQIPKPKPNRKTRGLLYCKCIYLISFIFTYHRYE